MHFKVSIRKEQTFCIYVAVYIVCSDCADYCVFVCLLLELQFIELTNIFVSSCVWFYRFPICS